MSLSERVGDGGTGGGGVGKDCAGVRSLEAGATPASGRATPGMTGEGSGELSTAIKSIR